MLKIGKFPTSADGLGWWSSLWRSLDEPYNVVSLAIGMLGLVAGGVALWVAFSELRKTREATEAVGSEVRKIYQRLDSVGALVDVTKCRGLCEQVLILISDSRHGQASQRLSDLRAAVAVLKGTQAGLSLMQKRQWTALGAEITLALTTCNELSMLDEDVVSNELSDKIGRLIERFAEMEGRMRDVATGRNGALNANT